VRSKSRILKGNVSSLGDLPQWNYDGSSTGQAPTESSEVILKPVNYFPDPFRGGENVLVMCEALVWADKARGDLKPADTNFRHFAAKIHEQVKD